MKNILLNIVVLSTLFISCGPASEYEGPSIITCYLDPFPKKTKNLTNILGDEFTIVTEKGKAITYSVTWDKETRTSTIVEAHGPTLFSGQVSKYKGRYYFSEQRRDSLYWIHVVEIKDGKIRGLREQIKQMSELDFIMRLLISSSDGDYVSVSEMIAEVTEDQILLIPDRDEMRKIYDSMIEEAEVDSIVEWVEPEEEEEELDIEEMVEESIVTETLIAKVYPNPADDQCTIELTEAGEYMLSLISGSGQKVRSEILKTKSTKVDLSELDAGVYIFQVHRMNGEAAASHTIVIR